MLGAVFLAVTGGEALYADMGHFGQAPIRIAWFALVLPALLSELLRPGRAAAAQRRRGQSSRSSCSRPRGRCFPLVGLATAAAIIASQALISGAFSLTQQAIQLGYCPRLDIEHTSSHEMGQVYVPQVNWALMVCTILIVIGFGSSSALAAAYGIARHDDDGDHGDAARTSSPSNAGSGRSRWRCCVTGGVPDDRPRVLRRQPAEAVRRAGGCRFVIGACHLHVMTTWKTGRPHRRRASRRRARFRSSTSSPRSSRGAAGPRARHRACS